MKKIIESNKQLTGVEKYLLTQSQNMRSVKDIDDGSIISVKAWCRFTDVKDDGEEVTILSFLSDKNEVYATNSTTFWRSFSDIQDLVDDCEGELEFLVEKISGQSKSGRPFVNCCLHVEVN